MAWDFALLRRNSPTPSELSTSSTASTTSMPIIYDSKTSKLEIAQSFEDIENDADLMEADANGRSLSAELKLNIGSKLKPIMTHFAWVDLSSLSRQAKNERRSGRINSIYIRV